jgi:hypothetical protein
MEETRSSETSVYNKPTRHHIPEDGIFRRFEKFTRYIQKGKTDLGYVEY